MWPNTQSITQLYEAGSAQAAVNILFPSLSWPDRTAFEREKEEFKLRNFSPTDVSQMRRYYAFQYLRDPYEAKKKFFSLFEDIFAVDRGGDILFTDIENHFDILYDHTLWNYKTLVKKVLFDAQKPEGSFAMWKYLDLLNQPNKNAPNENYAREMLQLFLMGEYKPWEDAEHDQAIRNYTEEDVYQLARLLTGFRAGADKRVYFDADFHHTGTGMVFLEWPLKSGISFPFYQAETGIDNTLTPQSLGGNNGLWDNMVDYIFAKREAEIAYFLAWRIFKFYIHDTPWETEIRTLANQIISYNFELFPVVKWLLASDMMYSDAAMNQVRFKNPLELSIGTLKLLTHTQPESYNNIVMDTSLLTILDWTPYNPFSIFGRAGFDDNEHFMNSYLHNQWVTYASKLAFDTNAGSWVIYQLSDLIPETRISQTQGTFPVLSHTGNTYSGSIQISDIRLQFLQDFPRNDLVSFQTQQPRVWQIWNTFFLSSMEDSISETPIPEEISVSIEENSVETMDSQENESSSEISETIPENSEMSQNIQNEEMKDITSESIEASIEMSSMIEPSMSFPASQSSEDENISENSMENLEISSENSEVVSPWSSQTSSGSVEEGEIPENEVKSEDMWVETVLQSTSFLEEDLLDISEIATFEALQEDDMWEILEDENEENIQNNFLSFSGSFQFPTFRIQTASGGIINFNGEIDFDKNIIYVSSGTYRVSGTTYDIVAWEIDIVSWALLERDIDIEEMLQQLENFLYFWKRLPVSVREQIKTYLLTDNAGNARLFLPNNTTYMRYIRAVLAMMLAQPEFMLLSWYDAPVETSNQASSLLPNSSSKLIMIELFGGYDWLNAMVPKDEFNTVYQEKRAGMKHDLEWLIDLWDVYMNKSFEPFKPLFDAGDLRIMNRVGAPNHSRAHDAAARQIASKYASQSVNTPWVIGDIIRHEPDVLKNIVLSGAKPRVYQDGRFLSIWGNSALYKNNFWPQNTLDRTYQIETMKNIVSQRPYPWTLQDLFTNSVMVNEVWTDSKNAGGQEWSGYNLKQRLTFLSSLIQNNVWVTYYVPGGGWYDTHGDQERWNYNLNNRVADLATDITEFFTLMKNQNQDVTIVVFSEFWRTLKTNGWVGTDHGQWGGMFVLSTNNTLKNQLPQKVYGKLSLEKEYEDWFWVGIDYRAIYSIILQSLYNINPENYFEGQYQLKNYINEELPVPVLLRKEFRNVSGSNLDLDLKFDIDDENFHFREWSYVKFFFWEDPENLREESKYTMSRNTLQADGTFRVVKRISESRVYHYRLQLTDNQYDTYVLTGTIQPPKKYAVNLPTQVQFERDNFFVKYANTSVWENTSIDPLVLFNMPDIEPIETTQDESAEAPQTPLPTYTDVAFSWGIVMRFGTGETSISTLQWSGDVIWNGWFLLPKEIEKQYFLTKKALYQWTALSYFYIDKILKIWADTLWVGMKLNQKVGISFPVNDTTKEYRILRSEDGISWQDIVWTDIVPINGRLSFETDHFSFFAVVEAGNNPTIPEPEIPVNPPIINPNPVEPPVVPNPPVSSSSSWGWVSILRMDVCPNGDLSPSYYDGTCDKIEWINTQKTSSISSNILSSSIKKEYRITTLKYRWYEITQIRWYNTSKNALKLSMWVITHKQLTQKEKEILVKRINAFLLAKYNFDTKNGDTKLLKTQYNKETLLLKSALTRFIKN